MNSQLVNLSEAEKIIGYNFIDKSLLRTAFTHSSYTNEHKSAEDYQRLEFLGDAVLGLVTGLRLFHIFPSAKEGELTKRRAALVSAETLAAVIDELDLIKYMSAGAGQAAQDVILSENVKCDLFEAIIGAIVVDCGDKIDEAERFIERNLTKYFNKPCIDYKSKILEYCAKKHLKCIIDTEKDDNVKQPTFTANVYVEDKLVATGSGKSKIASERVACRFYYESLGL